MRSGHTVNGINGVIASVRRLETEQATQEAALASRERMAQEALSKEHEIAKNGVAQIQKGLGKLQTGAESRLQAVNLELPASRETPSERQTGDTVTLLADSQKVSARLSGLVLELERYRKLRNEWLLALTAFTAACDDADNKLSRPDE